MAERLGVDRKEDEMDDSVRKMLDDGIGDARVRSVSWRGDDFIIELALPPDSPERRSLFLCCRRACNVKIDMDFGEYIGSPLLFGVEVERIDNRGWAMQFEFGGAPDGEISLHCTDVVQET